VKKEVHVQIFIGGKIYWWSRGIVFFSRVNFHTRTDDKAGIKLREVGFIDFTF
tara:strand:- start:236 stop:394 length:159 start_codon:yes stop_codon:yes gene_type:complete